MNNQTQYLTVHEAAALLRVTPKQVRKWCLTRRIRAVKSPGGRKWLIPAARLEVTVQQGSQ